MSNLQMFKFESHFVRIEMRDSAPWFCLKDVCDILQILNRSKLRSRMKSEGITKSYISKNNRNYSLLFVNEPNLYRVIFQSNKSEAQKFQNWVFEEVLPSIRKTGSYSIQKPEPRPINLEELKQLRDKVRNLRRYLSTVISQRIFSNVYIYLKREFQLYNITSMNVDQFHASLEKIEHIEKEAWKLFIEYGTRQLHLLFGFSNPKRIEKYKQLQFNI